MKGSILAVALAAILMGQAAYPQQNTVVPDAPAPEPAQPVGQDSIKALSKDVVPGSGTSQVNASTTPDAPPVAVDVENSTAPPAAPHKALPDDQKVAPAFRINLGTVPITFINVPVVVEDKHRNLVPGLDWRDFRIYENNVRQNIAYWSVSPVPLSVALVIDQSVGEHTMARVNDALAALPGAFAAYDEVGVWTYNTSVKQQTTFTAAEGERLPAVLAQAKTQGRDILIGPGSSSPMGQSGVYQNDTQWQTLPTITNGPSAGGLHNSQARQVHPLSDAIFMAAQALAKTEPGRRRVIYVISDGQDRGSEYKESRVIDYLEEHQIAVFGTLVGESAEWGMGRLDRFHLPLMAADNQLYKYTAATGGQVDAEFSTNAIERSFAAIAEEVRNQYTIGYYSHESIYDGKFRPIRVDVERPGLTVISKKGYYPSAPEAPAAK